MDSNVFTHVQGELERLFDLEGMLHLSQTVLGFDPEDIGSTVSPAAFARALVSYCHAEDALPALVDAILYSSGEADRALRGVLSGLSNGELKPGTRVGDLEVVKKIGEGGLSMVYLAERKGAGEGERAALKVIRPEFSRDRAAVHRFTAAARFLQSVRDSGLAPIMGVGQLSDSRPWVAARYLPGQTLAERLRRNGPLHINEALPILRGVLTGLSALHARGVVHADVKAENVFVHREEGEREPHGVLVDAGVDRLLSRGVSAVGLTGLLPVIGTAKAIAPEQARGAEPDARSDIYGVGTLLYEVLTGRPPFVGDSAIDVIAGHLAQAPEPPSLHARKGWVSDGLDDLVLKALAKDPADRFASAADLLAALETAQRRPGRARPLDEAAFGEARAALLEQPEDERRAEAVEAQAREADAFQRAADVFVEAATVAGGGPAALSLLFRAARLFELELRDPMRAEAVYQRILEQDEENVPALRGIEAARRASGDHEGVISVLIERVEREPEHAARLELLREVARIYEKELDDPDNAVVAWVQVLTSEPSDNAARSAVARLARGNDARWQEAIETVSATAQELVAGLDTDETQAREAAEAQLAQAREQLEQYRAHFDAVLAQRQAEAEAQKEADAASRKAEAAQRKADRAARAETLAVEAEQARLAVAEAEQVHRAQLEQLAAHDKRIGDLQELLDGLEARCDELSADATRRADELDAVHAEAEAKVNEYEALEEAAGEAPSEAQVAQLSALGEAAEALVERADTLDGELNTANEALDAAQAEVDAVRAQLTELAPQRDAAAEAVEQAEDVVDQARNAIELLQPELDGLDDAELSQAGELDALDGEEARQVGEDELLELLPEVSLTAEEQAQLAAVEALVDQAEAAIEALDTADAREREAQKEQEKRDAVALYTLLGSWYGGPLRHPEFALSCFGQALALDPDHEPAHEAIVDLYRNSQSWKELSEALLRRAEAAKSPLAARDARAEAASVLAEYLGDPDTAKEHLEAVLADDPDHHAAQVALSNILTQRGDHEALVALLEQRVKGDSDGEALETHLLLAELYESSLADVERAQVHLEAVLDIDDQHVAALKALERLYSLSENYEGLLRTLQAQVDLASTPKQRIALLERIGALQEEEFVDLPAASSSFEDIVAIDAGHDAANSALSRLYRQLSRFEDVVETLERHAGATIDEGRKLELLMQAERVLAVEIGAPERAMELCERALLLDEGNASVLSELARLKSTTGEVEAAVKAVVRLAEQAQDPAARAKHFVQAAKLLDDSGDKDGAIEHFKQALDADRNCAEATDALRALYKERGDAHGTIDMLRQTIANTEGELKRAALQAELGELYLTRFDDRAQARAAYEEAVALEPSNATAAIGLGRIAFDDMRFAAAAEHLQVAMDRVDELDSEQGSELCALLGRAYAEIGETDKSLAALDRARKLRPESFAAAEEHARAVAASGNHKAAEELYAAIMRRFDDSLSPADRVNVLLSLARAQLENGHAAPACESLEQALALRKDDPEVLAALTRAQRAAQNYSEVINLLQQRADMAPSDAARFELLVETGDVFLEHLRDRDAAAQTYGMALEIRPDSRNLLTKLMAVYSDMRDWSRLIEVILRIADMVDEPAQLAKYYNTAATIAHEELGRFDEAANYYEEAISAMSVAESRRQFDGLIDCLTQNQDWERLERVLETRIGRLHDESAEPKEIAAMIDRRAEVVRDRLGRAAEAMYLFEEAQRLDPDNQARREMLTAIYTKEPKRYFQQAVEAHRGLLVQDPVRIESLQALRRIYTSGKKPDESWCLCQALRCLQATDADEEKFFKKYRLSRLAKTKHSMDESMWRELVLHPAQDPGLTAIFAALSPAIISVQAQELAAFGVLPEYRTDPANDSTAMGRMLAHVGEAMGMRLPDVYHAPQDAGGLSFLFTAPPAVGIGQGALAGGPQQALAFVAARHVSYFRAGHIARQLVPTGTGLRAWILAAIRQVSPALPVPTNMEGQVAECAVAIGHHLTGPQRDTLRSLTQKLLDAAPELDMKRWIAGVDLTADRVGFVLSNDLKIANAVVEASPEDASIVGRADRLRELIAYSVSEPYFDLRKRLGIALGR